MFVKLDIVSDFTTVRGRVYVSCARGTAVYFHYISDESGEVDNFHTDYLPLYVHPFGIQ